MKGILPILVWLCLPLFMLAQPPDELPPENAKIRAQRVAYITERLKLNAEESAHFWGVETEHNEQRRVIMERYRQERRTRPKTEREAEAVIAARFTMEQELLDLRKQMYARYREKVPATKLMQLPQAEKEFRRSLLRQLRPQGPPPHRRN